MTKATRMLMYTVDVEKAIGVAPIETIYADPHRSLYEALRRMLVSRARRIPLVDVDPETGRQLVVSVITQYRILKFVAINVTETQMLRKPLKDLNLGTYDNVATARMETPVIEVIIEMLVKRSISSVPIVDDDRERPGSGRFACLTWTSDRLQVSCSTSLKRWTSSPSSRAARTTTSTSASARRS